MALPGKRHPRSLGRHRRSAWMARLKPAQLVACPKCKTPKLPHVVCHVCGTYKGSKVIAVKHHLTRSERRALQKAQVAKEKAAERKTAHTHDKSDKK